MLARAPACWLVMSLKYVMLGGPRRLSAGELGAYSEPAFGSTMSGFVRVGEGGAGREGSGLSRAWWESDSRGLVVAARACLESYTAAMVEVEGPAPNLIIMVTE